MNRPAQELGGLCKQISLNLHQDNSTAAVQLMGDILPDDSLVLSSALAFEVGKPARLAVCFLEQSFQVKGAVESCTRIGSSFLLNFRLHQQDKLQTRMLLQLSEIEQYRHYQLSQGRVVSIDEAASEWVKRYAEDFAVEFDADHKAQQ